MGLSKKQKLSATAVLAAIKTVDGASSGVDADLLDGKHASEIVQAATEAVNDLSSYTAAENKIPMGGEDGKIDVSWLPENISSGGGSDGVSPHIGSNGNWYLGNTDTGVQAAGTDGQDGQDGAAGADGQDGADGITPHIGTNGNWYLGSTDTGVAAGGSSADLSPATADSLGGVMVGSGLTVADDGTLSLNFQTKSVTPTKAGLTVQADSGNVLNKVVIAGDTDLVAANIKSGVTIFGVTGTYSLTPLTFNKSGTAPLTGLCSGKVIHSISASTSSIFNSTANTTDTISVKVGSTIVASDSAQGSSKNKPVQTLVASATGLDMIGAVSVYVTSTGYMYNPSVSITITYYD